MNVRLCAHAMPAVYGCALSSLSVGELEEWVDGWARCHFLLKSTNKAMNHGGQKWENKNRIEEKRKVYCAETDSRRK